MFLVCKNPYDWPSWSKWECSLQHCTHSLLLTPANWDQSNLLYLYPQYRSLSTAEISSLSQTADGRQMMSVEVGPSLMLICFLTQFRIWLFSLQTPVKLSDGYYKTDGHFTMSVLKVCESCLNDKIVSKTTSRLVICTHNPLPIQALGPLRFWRFLYFGVISLFSFPHPGKLWRFSCIFLFVDKLYAGQVSGAQLTGLDGAGRSHEVKIQYGDFGQASSEVRQLCSGTTLGLN